MYFNFYAVKAKKLSAFINKPVKFICKDDTKVFIEVDGLIQTLSRQDFRFKSIEQLVQSL